MQIDLPDPVVPAISKCGIEDKSPVIGEPEISFPNAIGRAMSGEEIKSKVIYVPTVLITTANAGD